jgi:hypothetical protein
MFGSGDAGKGFLVDLLAAAASDRAAAGERKRDARLEAARSGWLERMLV